VNESAAIFEMASRLLKIWRRPKVALFLTVRQKINPKNIQKIICIQNKTK
jgi:hypothetical protein